LLESDIVLDRDESFGDTVFDAELQDLLVAFFSFALDILASWFDSEFPRALQPCVLFETVVGCSIVAFDFFEVGDFVVFF
jgi:hypothetical protein